MDKIFLTILNMSLTGAFVIAVICLARLLLRKAPKVISYCLWAVAGFRLAFPFSIESVFSLIPFKAQTIPPDIAMRPIPRIDSGVTIVDNIISGALPAAAPQYSANPLQIWTVIGAYVWLAGIAVMFIYGAVSFIILKQKMRGAAHINVNIYEAENIKSPFVLGFFTPKIYLPIGLSAQERGYIILHEQTHIRRRDHIVKIAAYFILCLHWFNPLVWAAFILMSSDMEMSCDERVLKKMGDRSPAGNETKKDYSMSLLSLAAERRIINGSPLAFGEGDTKRRIKNVLNFKKSSKIVVLFGVIIAAVLTVGCALNRTQTDAYEPEVDPSGGVHDNYTPDDIPAETDLPGFPVGSEDEISSFILFHHYHELLMNNDDITPEANTLFAIYKTYVLEAALGNVFDADERGNGLKIPAWTVKNAVAYFYTNVDGHSVEYDDSYVNQDDPDYFWLPDGFGPGYVLFSIQPDTLTVINGTYKFDVIFYEDSPGMPELYTFTYTFEQDLYKDEIVCFRFTGAVRTK